MATTTREHWDESLWRQASRFLIATGTFAVYLTGFYLFFYAVQHHLAFFRVLGWQYQPDFVDCHCDWTAENARTGEQLYALARERPWDPAVVVPLAITATFRMFESLMHTVVLFVYRVRATPPSVGEVVLLVWRLVCRPYQYILNIAAAMLAYPLTVLGGNPVVYMTRISELFWV